MFGLLTFVLFYSFIGKPIFKEKSEKQKVLSAQGIELHVDSHEVYKDNIPLNLTRLEFELLQTFLNHKNQVLTRDILIQQVWG